MKEKQPLNSVPNSVAIIMDGNGRWATRRGLARTRGHLAGAKNIEAVLSALRECGVHYVTLYAFSTENWKRPKEEVDAIFSLIYRFLDERVLPYLKREPSVSLRFLGDPSPLPVRLRDKCHEVESYRRDTPFVVAVALNYGARDELFRAIGSAIEDGVTSLDDATLRRYLDTRDMPDPDLLIRTGGDMRLSNFLLYQCAYTELVFVDTLWPDFGGEEVRRAIEIYSSRKRRYGGLDLPHDTSRQERKEI